MKFRMFNIVTLFFFAGIILFSCGEQKKEVTLAYKFSPDKIYHFIYESETSTSVYEAETLSLSDENHLKVNYTQKTVEILSDSSARLQYDYKMTQKGEGPRSARDKGNFTEWTSECIMDRNGRVVEFSPDSTVPQQTIDYYRQLFEQTSPMYPSRPVSEGYSWSHTVKVSIDNSLTDATTDYTVKSLVREGGYDCALIEYRGVMYVPLAENPPDDENIEINAVDKIEVSGVAYFAYTEGIVIREDESTILTREGTQTKEGIKTEFKIDERRTFTSQLLKIEKL
jgi:hypothetical protein